jgi:hypothetical protein
LTGQCWGNSSSTIEDINLQECSPLLDRLNPPILFLKSKLNGQIQGVVKKTRSLTEEHNLKRLNMHCFANHCVPVLKSSSSVILMKYVQPFYTRPSIKSIKCLLSNFRQIPNIELVIKSILFQIIAILDHLQKWGTQFCHNDFKADNIMLERCYTPLLFGNHRIHSWGVRVVLIDAETVTGAGYKISPLLKKLSKSSRAAFGFETMFSPYTDLHLLCMEFLLECKRSGPSWKNEFVHFLNTDAIPVEYFHDIYVTSENRLNAVGRLALENLARPLGTMLHSVYFKDIYFV